MRKIASLTILILILFANPILSQQDQALQKLIQGKKAFWEARFDRATSLLKQVIQTEDVAKEYLFEAYLYTGFVLMRQNTSKAEINANFEKAIRLNVNRKLDEMVIPPDLTQQFNGVRDRLVGCLYVMSEPPEVNLIGVFGDSILFEDETPLLICEVVDRKYQLLFTAEGYEEEFMTLDIRAGQTDTLSLSLVPSRPQRAGMKNMWRWVIRGGIVATAGAVLYKTVIESSGNETGVLSAPPARPDPTAPQN